jgi:phosphoenolpyruvate-protein phosphotransferase (PTS system enzyme I)
MRKGVSVSPGVAVGTAYCIDELFAVPDAKRLQDNEVTAELARYETARDRAAADIRAVARKVANQVGKKEASIFTMHESILRDGAFTNKIRGWIVNDRISAGAALGQLMTEYQDIFAQTQDEYLRERVNDVRDVVVRLNSHLAKASELKDPGLDGPVIVVANELLPSQAVSFGDIDVHGIVTQSGSSTSHAAIVARSRGIPAIAGVRGALKYIRTGDTLIVDGREGVVIAKPDTETITAYRKLEREFFDLKDHLAENRDRPAVTADGTPLQLLANINSPGDAKAAVAMGSGGVGLYRTEYLYLTHPDVPTEEEQLEVYREVIRQSPNHQVTIRSLDIGGDKTVMYLGRTHTEANPFMGWRSIRLSFEHQEFFTTQLRAILRAAEQAKDLGGEVRIMFPMITTLEEMRQVRGIVRRTLKQLRDLGSELSPPKLGMMLEVPAAAITIDYLLEAVDFVSIGSNDLVQYLMAADRDNPKVNHLCQPLSPAVLRVLQQVITACNVAGKPVSLCGEMAGQPRAFVLLLGMGLRSFSMSPAFLPSIKELASQVSIDKAEELLRKAMQKKTTKEVNRLMEKAIRRLAPDLAILDTA